MSIYTFYRSSLKSLDLYPETLTLEEKRSLISTINKLPPEKMSKVVDIIQSAISTTDRDDDGEVEIPLDELDVKTLRRLQDYVEVRTMHTVANCCILIFILFRVFIPRNEKKLKMWKFRDKMVLRSRGRSLNYFLVARLL
jgi:Bromodomain extra-terminal - transcription regulation